KCSCQKRQKTATLKPFESAFYPRFCWRHYAAHPRLLYAAPRHFSGDTGYFDGFRTIGERLGPFDVTLIETGAYDAQWPYVHMQPEETVQAHIDLRGRWLVPIHNGTFDLAMHRWQEPFERVTALAIVRGIELSTPRMGERLALAEPHRGERWWRTVDEREPSVATKSRRWSLCASQATK
ncbi:MBL fold metallo-hydrolase, partial [Burkholderia cepacia]|nr:MBL fold metallo-hydrolase [Burkholderia cepacia]